MKLPRKAKKYPQTRRKQVAEREGIIIQAARQIFNEKGYSQTTISEIARCSGVADGTVYLYFENKAALAHAVLSDFYDRLTEGVKTGVAGHKTLKTKLEYFATYHMQSILEYWRLLEMRPLIHITMDNYESSALYQMNKAYTMIFDQIIKDAIEQGCLEANKALWIWRDIFFGAMEYGVRTLIIKHNEADIADFVTGLLTLMFQEKKGIRTEPICVDVLQRLEKVTERLEHCAMQTLVMR